MSVNNERELISAQHLLINELMKTVAYLAIIDQIDKTGRKAFIYNNIVIELSVDVIVLGLKVNLKDYLIEENGEVDGLAKCFIILKEMYIEKDNKPIELSKTGHELIDTLFISVVEDYQKANPTEPRSLN